MHRGLVRNALLLAAVTVLVLDVGGGGEAAPRVRGTRTRPRVGPVRAVVKGPMFAFASDLDRYSKGTHAGYNSQIVVDEKAGLIVRSSDAVPKQREEDLSFGW